MNCPFSDEIIKLKNKITELSTALKDMEENREYWRKLWCKDNAAQNAWVIKHMRLVKELIEAKEGGFLEDYLFDLCKQFGQLKPDNKCMQTDLQQKAAASG